jgi:hypothetical protein
MHKSNADSNTGFERETIDIKPAKLNLIPLCLNVIGSVLAFSSIDHLDVLSDVKLENYLNHKLFRYSRNSVYVKPDSSLTAPASTH